MKTYTIGDIHGGYKALKQVLERAKFDKDKDTLISLGDVCDGWSQTPQCIELLMEIKNLVFVMGNHDFWLDEWFKFHATPDVWTKQGGKATIDAYIRNKELVIKHRGFFKNAVKFYRDDKNRIYVHGGFNQEEEPEKTDLEYCMWDRTFWSNRHNYTEDIKNCSEVIVGHTSIYRFSKKPLNIRNIWFMDTGGGCEGKLSLMNVDTKEIFQSEKVSQLYPNEMIFR